MIAMQSVKENTLEFKPIQAPWSAGTFAEAADSFETAITYTSAQGPVDTRSWAYSTHWLLDNNIVCVYHCFQHVSGKPKSLQQHH